MTTLAPNPVIESADRQGMVTTAVIVAAGTGSRLRGESGTPKPLIAVAGVALIARVMADAARAGIRRFVVVIGYQAERMRRDVPALVPTGCTLELVENERFEEPNGLSLAAASSFLTEPFALLMSDHLFSPDRLVAACEQFQRRGRSLLVVERAGSFSGDLEDATRVATRDGGVHAIGKELASYDAIDTGMFVLGHERVALAVGAAGSSPSISDVMRVLAAAGQLDSFDPEVGAWQDVDTPADLLAAEKMQYRSLHKPTDGFMASLINRRVSLFLTKRLWRYGVTPNLVTTATLGIGIAAGVAFAQGSGWRWALLGATLFQLQSIIDGVDGELARLLNRESRFGFWFDLCVDNLTHICVFVGIAIGQAASGVPGPWTALGLVAALGVIASLASAAPLLLHDRSEQPTRPGSSRSAVLVKRIIENLTRRDFTYLLFPAALFGWLGVFLWAAAVGTWVFATITVLMRVVLLDWRSPLSANPSWANPSGVAQETTGKDRA